MMGRRTYQVEGVTAMKVFDTNIMIAVRCAYCGRIKFHSISIFDLLANRRMDFYCSCKAVELSVWLKDNRTIILRIPCVACGSVHTYRYSLKEILKKNVTVVYCDSTDFELCFLGKSEDVKNMVRRYQDGISELLGELGLSNDDGSGKHDDTTPTY